MEDDVHLTIVRPLAATFRAQKDAKERRKRPHTGRTGSLARFWAAFRGGGRFPWRPTPIDWIRGWLLSSRLQLAAQLVVAHVWTGLYTFVRCPDAPEESQ